MTTAPTIKDIDGQPNGSSRADEGPEFFLRDGYVLMTHPRHIRIWYTVPTGAGIVN